jgi:hypothetical protein
MLDDINITNIQRLTASIPSQTPMQERSLQSVSFPTVSAAFAVDDLQREAMKSVAKHSLRPTQLVVVTGS